MKTTKLLVKTLIGAAALSLAPSSFAAPIIFFGEDLTPGGTVPSGGGSETARNQFLGALSSGVGNEDFEGIAAGSTPPLGLSFPGSTGAITATLSGGGAVYNAPGAGRFATSGSNFYGEVTNGFNINFSSPISAFGFYATDIGDFNGQITLGLAGGGTTNLTVPNTINGPDGSLLFYGFADPSGSYTGITFGNTSAGSDYFGFDDLVIGDLGQVVATPDGGSTAALLGLALIGISRLKRKNI